MAFPHFLDTGSITSGSNSVDWQLSSKFQRVLLSQASYICVCVYIYIYTHTHTHTHILLVFHSAEIPCHVLNSGLKSLLLQVRSAGCKIPAFSDIWVIILQPASRPYNIVSSPSSTKLRAHPDRQTDNIVIALSTAYAESYQWMPWRDFYLHAETNLIHDN
jgi:hypothetical protein